ncbi:MAG: glycosyltransferase family 1 protein [Spartobacteria bacterium]|nr:glycosyltransferase family 1 protein [Spartobacteria bacterium]
MHIAFVIEHFNKQQGGAEQYAWGLARWLVARGHTLEVLTCATGGDVDFPCCVTVLDLQRTRGFVRRQRMADAVSALIKEHAFDMVQGFNHVWPCDVLRLGGGVHLAFEQYNLLSVQPPALRVVKRMLMALQPKYRALRRNEQRQFADPKRHFIAISERVAGDMRACYPHVGDRIHLIRNAVDTARFTPAAREEQRALARAKLGFDKGTDVLLFMSNNYRLKGLYDLLGALPEIIRTAARPVRLLVTGRGDTARYAGLIHRLGLDETVRLVGPVADSLAWYAAADALIHPSYYDAYGFVGLEAMACGLPVVMSRNSGVSEIMQDGNGAILLDMPAQKSTLAAAVNRALEPAFRTTARAVNRAMAEHYPLEENYRQVESLYQDLL